MLGMVFLACKYFYQGWGKKMAVTHISLPGKSGAARESASYRAIPTLVSAAALMAGLLASTGAQAQCAGDDGGLSLVGSGLTAITSMIGTVNTAFMTPGSAFVSSPESAPNQIGGGVWVRTVGGTTDTYSNTNFTGTFNNPFDPSAPNHQPNISCRTKIGQDFAGFQAGHDIAYLNQGGAGQNWHIGVMAGYIGAKFKDETPEGSIPAPLGGAMNGTFEAPYGGVYATFSKERFFADFQARADFYQGDFSGLRLDARGYSLTGNMGYNLALGNGWSLEPSVGGVYSKTSVDQMQAVGFMTAQANSDGTIATMPGLGAMQMQDVESLLGRASVKLGTSVALDEGRIVAYPFATASVIHEFAGDVNASVSAMGQDGIVIFGWAPARLRPAERAHTANSASAVPSCSPIPAGSALPAWTTA